MSAQRSILGVYDAQYNFSPLAESSAPTVLELRHRYELLITQGATDYDDLASNLRKLKELILAHGIPVRPFPALQGSQTGLKAP